MASGDFQSETWSVERGLPDSSVTAIAQTPDGYLWVGTYNGLARFDGVNFVTFDPENTPALAHPRVRQLFLDQQGVLWINTYDGSLTRMRDGHFFREWTAQSQNDRDNAMIASSTNAIAFGLDRGDIFKKPLAAPPGAGWEQLAVPNRNLLTTEFGEGQCLAWFNGQTARVWAKRMWRLEADHFHPMTEVMQLEGQPIRCVAPVDALRFWVGTDSGLALCDGRQFFKAAPPNGEAPADFKYLCPASDGGVWAVVNDGLRKFANGNWVCEAMELRGLFATSGFRFGLTADHLAGCGFTIRITA